MRSAGAPGSASTRERRRLWHSFAFRLGAAFAVVAFVGAGATALVVNAAFAARFDRYLQQQQASQLDRIGSSIARAYAGNGSWDRHALDSLASTLAKTDVRVVGSDGHHVWRWDGSSSWWTDGSMQDGSHHGSHSGTSQQSPSPTGGGGQGGWSGSDHHDGSSWGDQDSSSTWHDGGWRAMAESAPGLTVALGVSAASSSPSLSPSPSATDAGLGPVQRIPIVVDGKVVGTAIVRLPKPTALPDAVAFRAEVIRLLLFGGAIGALLSFGLGIFFARRATRPVRDATGAAHALASGDRTVRLGADRPDEFGELGRAFNSMANAVDAEERLRKSFAGEVAHELRTPLTILRTQVEGLRVGVLEPTPEALGSLDEEVQRMSRLVADLQILGSADAAGFSLERTTVDLREVVEEQVRQFSGLFEGSEVRLETRAEPLIGWVDPVRLGQIVANLLSNALKFTPAAGIVKVELRADGPWAAIRVSDSGPGIPPDELPHVFDRFFRGRSARPSGSGIGLTVVRELVEAQGGDVEVTSTPGQGATFTVRLPRQPAPSVAADITVPPRPLSSVPS